MFIGKNKNGFYYIHFKNINTGKYNKVTTKKKLKADAHRVLIEFQLKYQKELETGIKQISFQEFINFFTEKRKNDITENILDAYCYILNEFQKTNNINTLQDIKQIHIDNYKEYLNKACNKNSTIKSKMIKLMYCIEFAKANKFMYKDIEIKTPAVKLIEKEKEYVNENDFKELQSNCNDKDFKDVLIIAYYTGLRINEIINLKRTNVNLDKGFIALNNQDFLTKNRKTRIIPLLDPAIKAIESRCDQINDNDYVFTYKGKKWVKITLMTKFKTLASKTFLDNNKNYTFHSLRHGYASFLASKNINIYVIKELLGHQDTKTTLRYIHMPNSLIQDSINNIKLN